MNLKKWINRKAAAVRVESLEERMMYSTTPVIAASPLQATFNSGGLATVTYNGVELFDGADHPEDQFVAAMTGGNASSPNPVAHTSMFNTSTDTLTQTYGWGTVNVKYTVTTNAIEMDVTLQNASTINSIPGVNVNAAYLRLPQAPPGWGAGPTITFMGPQVYTADYGTGTVAFVNEGMTGAPYYTYVGATSQADAQINRYACGIISTAFPGLPTSWPVYNRPIAAGGTDEYKLALRFGAEGQTSSQLAPDVFSSFTAAHPLSFSWTDRRAIGMEFLSDQSDHSATNPRNWFGDKSIDVTTPAGLANFRSILLAKAVQSVGTLKKMNAQGMILWDPAGSQYVAADYIGDPRVVDALAPEMDYQGAIDAYFKTFTDAGLRVGVGIRAQQFEFINGQPEQVTPPDLTSNLEAKIAYAYNRWGATLFYIDSTGYNVDPSVYSAIHAAYPNVLLIPEQSNTGTYANAAAYSDVSVGSNKTPAMVRNLYPTAFSVINAVSAPVTPAVEANLIKGVRHGDVLLFQGEGYDPAEDPMIADIYAQAYKTPSGASSTAIAPAAMVGPMPAFSTPSISPLSLPLDTAKLGIWQTQFPQAA